MNADIKQELAALRARIDELEAQAKAEEADSWPKYGNECWAIDGDGDLFDFVWNLYDNQLHRLEIGNVFRTNEEAKREVERRKVLTQLRKLAKASWGGTKIDWTDDAQYKWQICFAHDTADGGKFGAINWHAIQYQGAVAFATKSAAQDAIETIGADRLMLLLED